MKDNPAEIAKYLIEKHGLKDASTRASESAFKAQEQGDLYDLSVWRDIRRIIYDHQNAAKKEEVEIKEE